MEVLLDNGEMALLNRRFEKIEDRIEEIAAMVKKLAAEKQMIFC